MWQPGWEGVWGRMDMLLLMQLVQGRKCLFEDLLHSMWDPSHDLRELSHFDLTLTGISPGEASVPWRCGSQEYSNPV